MQAKQLVELLSSDDVKPLDSEFDIEELIMSLNGLQDKIQWLKKLKDSRVQAINSEIEVLENRQTRLRDIISGTLESVDKKSLSFPGVGKVSIKKTKGTWNINDEDQILAHLREKLSQDEVDEIVVTKETIVKKNLNKVLDLWEKLDSLPDAVSRSEEKTSLSVTIDKSLSENEKMKSAISSTEDLDMDTFDGLPM